jgi:hypothetical protein
MAKTSEQVLPGVWRNVRECGCVQIGNEYVQWCPEHNDPGQGTLRPESEAVEDWSRRMGNVARVEARAATPHQTLRERITIDQALSNRLDSMTDELESCKADRTRLELENIELRTRDDASCIQLAACQIVASGGAISAFMASKLVGQQVEALESVKRMRIELDAMKAAAAL